MPERRTVERHKVWFPVRVDAHDLGHSVGVSSDASSKGILLACTSRIAVGAPVDLSFKVVPVEGEPRRVQGTVVRSLDADAYCQPWPYKVAVEFEQPDPALENVLQAAARALVA